MKLCLLLLPLVLGLTAESKGLSSEEKYIEARDHYIGQLKVYPNDDEDRKAIEELEKQLREIIGPIRIAGFSGQGTINLETLQDEVGFGQVDGLNFHSKKEHLFVTTKSLLEKYLTNNPKLPKNINDLAQNGNFYSDVINCDGAVTRFAEMPIEKPKNLSFARGFLMLDAQEEGPLIPKMIVIFAEKENYIFILWAREMKPALVQIPACKDTWDKFEKKSRTLDDRARLEEEGFKAYRNCFERELKNTGAFSGLIKQTQSLADHLK